MEQENQVQEAEIVEEKNEVEPIEAKFETEIDRAKKKRREAIFEMSLFLILGILLGITIKTEAVKKITIGFNDYQVNSDAARYDVAAIKKSLQDEAAAAEQAAQAQQAAPQE